MRIIDGHYLNLPVVENGDVMGIVDVLKLTYATMEQINSIQGNDGEGPMWGRFWDSFGAQEQHDTESQLSDPLSSQLLSANSQANGAPTRAISPEPSASFSQLQGFSEITPNESASMVANNDDGRSSMSEDRSHGQHSQKEDMFSFKFTTGGGKTHRFASTYDSYAALLEAVRQKVIGEHLSHSGTNSDDPVDSWLTISYLDDEEDQVLITSDADVTDAVKLARKMGQDRVKLFVHDATEKEEEVAAPVVVEEPVVIEEKVIEQPVYVPPPPVIEISEPKVTVEEKKPKKRSVKKQVVVSSDDESDSEQTNSKNGPISVAGIPQELILPAAIAFLGVVIIGVFAFSRVSSNNR